jgi:hypothetical protein
LKKSIVLLFHVNRVIGIHKANVCQAIQVPGLTGTLQGTSTDDGRTIHAVPDARWQKQRSREGYIAPPGFEMM